MNLQRVNTNYYNRYQNKLIHAGKYTISIQCNENVHCSPKINLKDPYSYDKFELVVFYESELVIPMGYKEYFDTDGIGKYLPIQFVLKILNYINSPVCMVMGVECL